MPGPPRGGKPYIRQASREYVSARQPSGTACRSRLLAASNGASPDMTAPGPLGYHPPSLYSLLIMSKSSKPAAPKDFESAIAELEGLVGRMESGELSLEAALAAYKRGMELSEYCRKTLDDAEQQVRVLENGALGPYTPSQVTDDE